MSDKLLAVDPSIRKTGAAEFVDGEIVSIYVVRPTAGGWFRLHDLTAGFCQYAEPSPGWELAIEYPKLYPDDQADPRKRKKLKNILKLASAAGAVMGAANWLDIHEYEPYEWKKQTPKGIACDRVYAMLPEHLQEAVDSVPKSARNDALDAAGVGLYHLGVLKH